MPQYSTIPISLRLIVLVLIIIFLIVLAMIILNSLGVVDSRGFLMPLYQLLGISAVDTVDLADPLLLVHQREKKNRDALMLWEEELALKEKHLNERETVVTQKEELLTDKEKSLMEAEKTVNDTAKELDDRRRRLEQKSETFRSMPPENAVKIMLEMDVQEVVEVLRVTEEMAQKNNELSIVPYWISLMPPEKAAEIDRRWR